MPGLVVLCLSALGLTIEQVDRGKSVDSEQANLVPVRSFGAENVGKHAIPRTRPVPDIDLTMPATHG